jgi:diacylglycerol kinase (ATP)
MMSKSTPVIRLRAMDSAPRPEVPPPYPARGAPTVWSSAKHAWDGLVHTVVHQRNMRIHVVAAILVGLVGCGIPLGLAEKVILIFCVLFVFFAEILNSALEHLVDLAVQQFDEKARVTKDAAAAGVLVLAIGTVVVFAAILVQEWDTIVRHSREVLRQAALGLPLAGCAAYLLLPRRKPRWADGLAFVGALGLWGAIVPNATSSVFAALTAGILILCGAAARERQRLERTVPVAPVSTAAA